MSDSPLSKKSNDKPEVQFTADKIGHWASKQENPFAEQNRKAAAKKQREHEQAKKATPIVAIILGIAAVIAAVGGLAVLVFTLINSDPLPDDITIGSEGAGMVLDQSQKIFTERFDKIQNTDNKTTEDATQEAIDAAKKFYDRKFNQATSQDQKNDLVLLEMELFNNNAQPQQVIDSAQKANSDTMTDMQKGMYWGMLVNAYFNINDTESANKYLGLLNSLESENIVINGEE